MSALSEDEAAQLWLLYQAIHETWGDETARVEDLGGQWREFITVKCEGEPSYTEIYRAACQTLVSLRATHAERLYGYLFFDPAVPAAVTAAPTSPLSQLKTLVIDEFIRVYVCSGGFRAYGGTNYGGFVSGSRYRARPPYRIAEGV